MALFGLGKKKSVTELRADIRSLEAKRREELKRDALKAKASALSKKYRELKYAKGYAAGRAVGRAAGIAGRTGLKLAGNAASNLSKYDYSPTFKADFGGGRKKRTSSYGLF